MFYIQLTFSCIIVAYLSQVECDQILVAHQSHVSQNSINHTPSSFGQILYTQQFSPFLPLLVLAHSFSFFFLLLRFIDLEECYSFKSFSSLLILPYLAPFSSSFLIPPMTERKQQTHDHAAHQCDAQAD